MSFGGQGGSGNVFNSTIVFFLLRFNLIFAQHFSVLPTSSTPTGGGRHSAQPDPERGRDPSLTALLGHHRGNAAFSF